MDRLLEFLDAPEQTFRFEYDQAKGIGHQIACPKWDNADLLPPIQLEHLYIELRNTYQLRDTVELRNIYKQNNVIELRYTYTLHLLITWHQNYV